MTKGALFLVCLLLFLITAGAGAAWLWLSPEGGMRDGLSLLDQCSSLERVDTEAVLHAMGLAGSYRIRELAMSIENSDAAAALEQYESLWMDGKEPSSLLNELAGFFRDTLLVRLAPNGGAGLVSGTYAAETMKAVSLTESQLLQALNTLEKYQAAMYTSANPRLQGELCMIELCGVSPAEPRPMHMEKTLEPAASQKPLPVKEAQEQTPSSDKKSEISEPMEEKPPEPVFSSKDVQYASTEPSELWTNILNDFNTPKFKGDYFVLSDPQLIDAEARETELILRVKPGFETGRVNRPEIINRIRQRASELAGRPIQVRIEEMRPTAAPDNDKLDQLGRFSNVTIR